MSDPDVLRSYAAVFEMKRRNTNNELMAPTEMCLAAAAALRFQADHIEDEQYQERINAKLDSAIR